MKNTACLLILIIIIFTGCSKEENEDSNKDADYYFSTSFLGETYMDEGLLIGGLILSAEECNTFEFLAAAVLGQFEKSGLFINAQIIYYEDDTDFQNSDKSDTDVVSKGSIIMDCFNNLDLDLTLYYNDENWILDTSKPNYNKIIKLSKLEESNLNVTYTLEGEYEGNFLNPSDNSTAKLKGSYRVPLHTLK